MRSFTLTCFRNSMSSDKKNTKTSTQKSKQTGRGTSKRTGGKKVILNSDDFSVPSTRLILYVLCTLASMEKNQKKQSSKHTIKSFVAIYQLFVLHQREPALIFSNFTINDLYLLLDFVCCPNNRKIIVFN